MHAMVYHSWMSFAFNCYLPSCNVALISSWRIFFIKSLITWWGGAGGGGLEGNGGHLSGWQVHPNFR